MNWFLILIVAYGICFGLQNKLPFLYSRLYREDGEKAHFFDQMLTCSYCTGFHAGWIAWLLCSVRSWPENWGFFCADLAGMAFAGAGLLLFPRRSDSLDGGVNSTDSTLSLIRCFRSSSHGL